MIFFWQGTGLLSYLLRIRSPEDLRFHAQYGGILESYVISEFLKRYITVVRNIQYIFGWIPLAKKSIFSSKKGDIGSS